MTDIGAADNEGKRGVKIGDRFSIYEKNLKVKKDDQGRFLFEKIGEVEIVKVFDQKSIGRITMSSKEMFMESGRTFYLDEIIQAAPAAAAPPMAPAAMPVVPRAEPSPKPAPVVSEKEALGPEAEFTREVVYFAFDDAGLTEPGMAIIEKKAQFLKQHPDKKTLIEGHCDERGSVEYNLALGERRAAAVRNQLKISRSGPRQDAYCLLRERTSRSTPPTPKRPGLRTGGQNLYWNDQQHKKSLEKMELTLCDM